MISGVWHSVSNRVLDRFKTCQYGQVFVIMLVLGVVRFPMNAQDNPTPQPSASAFYLEPTATFAPDLDALEGIVTARIAPQTFAPLTGEAFDMVLTVEIPQGLNLYEWVDFGEQWGAFEIVELSEVIAQPRADSGITYTQTITAKIWTPGDKEIPDAFIGYGASESEILRVPVRKEFFSVPTVVDFNDQTLRPMRPPVYLPYISPLIVLISVTFLGGAGYFARRWWVNRPTPEHVDIERSPELIAIEALGRIQQEGANDIYDAMVGVLRTYLVARFPDADLQGATTPELLDALRTYLPESAMNDLGRLLGEADLVKFAGKSTRLETAPRMIEFARRWIEGVEQATGSAEVLS